WDQLRCEIRSAFAGSGRTPTDPHSPCRRTGVAWGDGPSGPAPEPRIPGYSLRCATGHSDHSQCVGGCAVKPPKVPQFHRYAFELEMEINSILTFSAGELGALVGDGLFAMDDLGILFPGVKSPDVGDRLTSIRIGAVGYGRGFAAPTGDAYRRLILGPKP